MRFGKLLAAVTQNSPANEPYISYKELKHNISKVSVVCSGKDEDNSSGDDGALQQEILESYAASSSSSVLAASSNPKIVGPQQDFFSLLDQDLTAAQLYVQSNVSDVEAMLGEWQVAAVKAGLIFTPQQLEEVQRQLPVHMEEEALVDWLLSLTPGAKTRAARFALVDKYSDIARPLNSLLQYVEVNLTAVRKILKKFDKKIPPEFRMQKASDYKVHHELFTSALQQVLKTAVQMQRLVTETVAESVDSTVPISQLGPETLAVLSAVQKHHVSVDDVFGYSKGKIDVYAKPMTTGAPAASRLSTEPAVTKAAVQATTPVPLRPQQAGLVSREEEEEEDEVPEGQELAGKPRRRGGRNRKRGSRKDFEKSDAQPPQPAGKGKAKGQVQKEAAVSAGPSPCDSPPNAKPSPTTMVRAAMPMQMPLMHMAYPRLQPMYGGLPVFFPKAGQGKGPEPLIIGGPPGTLVDGNWFSMPMMWPQ